MVETAPNIDTGSSAQMANGAVAQSENNPFKDLIKQLESYLSNEDIQLISKAYEFGAKAHAGQKRQSGEPYIYHPVSVALILADMHMDADTIVAAILHDVIEDTPTAKDEISSLFNPTIATLVDGVSKLDHINFDNKQAAKAASFQKMMLAMVGDIRVILIKLADRLHNMRTLGIMRPDKQRRIARETLDIYVPIAVRLGINTLRMELQGLGLKALYPMRYRALSEAMRKSRGNRKEVMNKVEITVSAALEEQGVYSKVSAREKTIFSTYRKMLKKKQRFQDIRDLFAVRIVVDSVDQCYRALGMVHNLFRPVPGTFKDYIAIPKANGYQALHTNLFGPHGLQIEIQIRTEEMDQFAESGIAAHWRYKTDSEASLDAQSRLREWLQDLLELQQRAGNSEEFLENVKIDLFPDEIYVFTPEGDIIELPKGATAIDFAYAIHTDIGNSCMSVKIDNDMAPLSTQLSSGQTVSIITSSNVKPNANWLNWVVTARSRTAIRHYLKQLTNKDAILLGKRLLKQALLDYKIQIDEIPNNSLKIVLEEYGYNEINDLFMAIGLGIRMPKLVARRIAPSSQEDVSPQKDQNKIQIKGTEGLAVSYAKCCYPLPDDKIIGVASPGRGIVIHQYRCKNVKSALREADKWVDLEWDDQLETTFSAAIRVTTNTERGVLAQVASTIADSDCNIEHVAHTLGDNEGSNMNFVITVTNRKHLAKVMRRLRNRKNVHRVIRIRS